MLKHGLGGYGGVGLVTGGMMDRRCGKDDGIPPRSARTIY
jgi:hypothetical protein